MRIRSGHCPEEVLELACDSIETPFPCDAKFLSCLRNLRIKPLFLRIEVLFLRIKALFVETESLFYFCIGTKVVSVARKASFGGENLHIYLQMPLLRYSLSFLYGIAFYGKRFRLWAAVALLLWEMTFLLCKKHATICSFVNKSLLCTNFKETMQSQEMRSKYNLRSNEFHSGAVSFSFFEKDIFSSLVMR